MRIDDIRVRRGTTAEWTDINPQLNPGEVGLEFTDDNRVRLKFGTGNADFWSNLPYLDAWLAPISSPAFEDVPTAPMPDGNNPAQIANVEYVQQAIEDIEIPEPESVGAASTTTAGIAKLSKTSSDKAVAANEALYVEGIKTKYLADYASLAAAQTALVSAGNVMLVVSDTVNITTNLTTTPNIAIKFEAGGRFNVSAGITLTIGKLAPVGNRQIFTGDGKVRLYHGAVERINLAWWTGTYIGSGSLNVAKAINDAFDSILTYGSGIVYLPNGNYTTASSHLVPVGLTFEGDGSSPDGVGGSTLNYTGSSGCFSIKSLAHQTTFRKFNLVGSNAVTPVGYGIYPNDTTGSWLNGLTVEQVTFKNLAAGVYIHCLDANSWQVEQVFLARNWFTNCKYGIRCNTVNGTIELDQCYSLQSYGQVACMMEKVGMFTCVNHHFAGANPTGGATRLDVNAHAAFQFGFDIGLGSEHRSIKIMGGQDEGYYHSVIINSYDYLAPITLDTNTMQGLVQLNGNAMLLSIGNSYMAEAIRDKLTFFGTGSPVSARVISIGDTAGTGIDGTAHYRNIEGTDFGTNIAAVPIHKFVTSSTSKMLMQVGLGGMSFDGDMKLSGGILVPKDTVAFDAGTSSAIINKTAGRITGVTKPSWAIYSSYITPDSDVYVKIRTGTSLNNLVVAHVTEGAGFATVQFNLDPATLTPAAVDVSFVIINPA